MIRSSRTLLRCAVGALLLLVLTACGDTPVRAGAAATVGDARISTDELSAFVNRALSDPQAQQQLGADRVGFQRQSLSRLINQDLLAIAARQQGVTVTPGAIDARLAEFEQQSGGPQMLIQQAAQNGISEQDLRPFLSDLVLSDAIGDRLTADLPVSQAQLQAAFAQGASRNDQVHAAHILVTSAAQAASIKAKLDKDPAQFAALAARFSTDTSNKDKGGDLGFAGRGQFVPAFEKAIFGAEEGALLVVQTEFGFHVVKILERRVTTLVQVTPQLRRAILQDVREQRLTALLNTVARDVGVTVNPRFGRWNPASGAVEPIGIDDSSVSSPAPVAPADGLGAELGQTDPQGQPDQQQAPQAP